MILDESVPPAAGAARSASTAAQYAWALLDGARMPYNVLVNVFVFSAYFSTVVIPDAVKGQALWSYITSVSAVLVAIGAPVLGAIADAGGRRKPWLIATMAVGVPCMCALWFATPGMTTGLWLIVVCVIGAYLTFEYAQVFGNSLLPLIAPQPRIGFLSGLGFALGNGMGILLFAFFLAAWSWNPHPLFGLDPALHEPERAVGILASVWLIVFSLPFFFVTPDAPGTKIPPTRAVAQGFKTLAGTVAKVSHYRNVATFLAARMSFNEGFIVMILFTGIFAEGVLHWTPTMLIVMALANSVAASIAGFLAGWIDGRIGSKAGTILFVTGVLAMNLLQVSISADMVFFIPVTPADAMHIPGLSTLYPTLPDQVFLIMQPFVALLVTGGLVTARALMAQLSPPTMLNEFFGLYSMSGTATSFIGPLAIGLLTTAFASQRAGIAVGAFFLAIGIVLMFFVKEERAKAVK